MPLSFQLSERFAGFVVEGAPAGQMTSVIYRELLGPNDVSLTVKLEQLQGCLFSKIAGLPSPSQIDHLVVIINKDLSGLAYCNELSFRGSLKLNRTVKKGEIIFTKDVVDICSIDLGITVPADSAVIVVRALSWGRSLYYDFGPIIPDEHNRDYEVSSVLAQQNLLLIGLPAIKFDGHSLTTRAEYMAKGVAELEALLKSRSESEADYQELLLKHPWILAGYYTSVDRHKKLDDQNIPDFTATRCYDKCCDIIELKQPFISIFKEGNTFSSAFNDAWNQAERYLSFCNKQRLYLYDHKGLRFENPRCLLIAGYQITDDQLRLLREKEAMNRLIAILTYDQLLTAAKHLLSLAERAGGYIVNWN